jgi:hypothetical protein
MDCLCRSTAFDVPIACSPSTHLNQTAFSIERLLVLLLNAYLQYHLCAGKSTWFITEKLSDLNNQF